MKTLGEEYQRIKDRYMEEQWRNMSATPRPTKSKHGFLSASKDEMNDYNLTKFRMRDGAELTVETNEGWIEVDGLKISMDILRKVAKNINEEKAKEDYDKIPF
jgi:hypothetical protein